MKYLYILIVVLYFEDNCIAQTLSIDERKICGRWILKKGWFDKDVIELERLDSVKHKDVGSEFCFEIKNPTGVYNVFRHNLSVDFYNPQKLEACEQGLPYTEHGEWNLIGSKLKIDIKGGYRFNVVFHYILEYEVVFVSENLMTLKKNKVIKSYQTK